MANLTKQQVAYCLQGKTYGRADAMLWLQQQPAGTALPARELGKLWGWSHTQVLRFLTDLDSRKWLQLEKRKGVFYLSSVDVDEPKEPKATPAKAGLAAELTEGLTRVRRMKKPLTNEQAEALVEEYGRQAVLDTLQAMENYKPLTKYVATAQTARNWLSRSKGQSNGSRVKGRTNPDTGQLRSRAAEYAAAAERAERTPKP